MTNLGFTESDFETFAIPGLEPRMAAIIRSVRPKLEAIGEAVAPDLSAMCGEPMIPHVAKHMRRSVHPPEDTWVAWAASKRGYKALPHFQTGLFRTHLFIQFALIYECPLKPGFGAKLAERAEAIRELIPPDFFWSEDHTRPEVVPNAGTDAADLARMGHRLQTVKKAELLCGVRLDRGSPEAEDGERLLAIIRQTFEKTLPLYRLAMTVQA